MQPLSRYGLIVARTLMSMIFLLNAFAIIDQTKAAHELVERGAPESLVPLMMLGGRAIELIAGAALLLGIFPRMAALALLGFLVPATFVSHSFWLSAGTPAFQAQLANFSKNLAIWGGLIFIASTPYQPTVLPYPGRRIVRTSPSP